MKLSGQGLGFGLKNASFTFSGGEPRFRDRRVLLSQFSLPKGFVVSAASREEQFPGIQLVELM